jgi:hypothetical protein
MSPKRVGKRRERGQMPPKSRQTAGIRGLQALARHGKIATVSRPILAFPEVLLMRLRVHLSKLAPGLLVVSLVAGYAGVASAQTQFVPYFGKNNIHYDKFEWHIYTTDHFEIYYYPSSSSTRAGRRLRESAYQQISADLQARPVVQGAS